MALPSASRHRWIALSLDAAANVWPSGLIASAVTGASGFGRLRSVAAEAAFHAAGTNHLWTVNTDNIGRDTQITLSTGSSPSLTP